MISLDSEGFNPDLNPYVRKMQKHPQVLAEIERIWKDFSNSYAVVDLGCGNGHFLQEYLLAHPSWKGLGVERRFKRIVKTAEKLSGTHSHVLRWDVQEFLEGSPSQFWDEVWLQFPDPWPKAKHEKNRMVRAELFSAIYRVLKPGGRFCFRSDCLAYWKLLQEIQAGSGEFRFSRVTAQEGNLFEKEPKTLFQKKFALRQVPIYSLEFRK